MGYEGWKSRIRTLEAESQQLRMDGRGDDWRGLPTIVETRSGLPEDGTVAIQEIGIAPIGTTVAVMIGTRDVVSQSAGVFWLEVDAWDDYRFDFRLRIMAPELALASLYGVRRRSTQGVQIAAAWDEILEVQFDMEKVVDVLRHDMEAGRPRDVTLKRWVRVRAASEDRASGQYFWGPVIGSFVGGHPGSTVTPDRPIIDEDPVVVVQMPLAGMWVAYAGPESHRGRRAFDLDRSDLGFHSFPREARDAVTTRDHYSWGQVVYSPTEGIVAIAEGSYEDNQDRTVSRFRGSNHVRITSKGKSGMVDIAHLQEGSVEVKPGMKVEAGSPIGLVGSSGARTPHVHIEARDCAWKESLRLAFENVWVGLNPVEADFWTVLFDRWEVEEGFFVRGIEPWHDTMDSRGDVERVGRKQWEGQGGWGQEDGIETGSNAVVVSVADVEEAASVIRAIRGAGVRENIEIRFIKEDGRDPESGPKRERVER